MISFIVITKYNTAKSIHHWIAILNKKGEEFVHILLRVYIMLFTDMVSVAVLSKNGKNVIPKTSPDK